jgi:hypothetical protein
MIQPDDKLYFDYIKGNHFRVISVDGVTAQLNPNLSIQFVLWNERSSIPKRVAFSIEKDGSLGDVISDECDDRESVVREIEVCFSLDIDSARSLLSGLQERLEELEHTLEEVMGEDDLDE